MTGRALVAGCLLIAWFGQVFAEQPLSGYQFLSPETRAMQDDEFENPGMMAVDRGERLFYEHREYEEHACVDCHGGETVRFNLERIASYPLYDETQGGLVTLQGQVNYCWEINMDRFPLQYDDPELVDLETFVRYQARGLPIRVEASGRAAELLKKGEAIYRTRYGQIDMSCYHCHVQHQGQMLRGQKLSHGMANGFPEYRLGKGRITSLHKRLRECFVSFRADPFSPGSEEFKLLELYLMWLGNGLEIETPAVRF